MNKCLFLDRDGTINTFGMGYTYKEDGVHMIPGIEKLVARFVENGYKIIVITNQGGIGKGLYKEEDVLAVNEHIDRLLRKNGGHIDGLYYCPHNAKDGIGKYRVKCNCRKPEPGLVLRAIEDFDIDKEKSIFLGDNYTDMMCAKNAGVRFYPFEFRHVKTTPQGFRITINEYTDEMIEDIFRFAENT